MPIQFGQIPRFSPEELNPNLYGFLNGLGQGANFAKQARMFPLEMQKQQIANQLEEYKRQQAEAEAPYYGDIAKAKAKTAQLEPEEIQARMGLLGNQSAQIAQQMKFYPQEIQARISEQKALAAQHQADIEKTNKMLELLEGTKYPSTENMVNSANPANPQTNSMYGITIPTPTKDDMANKVFFGMDTYSSRLKDAQDKINDEKKKYDALISKSINESDSATKANQALNVFNRSMNESFYKGPTLGSTPSSGFMSALVPGNLAAEQQADYAANQLLPSAISQLTENMQNYRFTNMDMTIAQRYKFYRGMTDESRNFATQWFNAVNSRMEEKPKFLTTLKGKVDADTAEMLWSNYQQNQQLINSDGKTIMNQNLNKWPIYTTPNAIESIRTTGSYKPSKAVLNAVWMKLPDNTIIPVSPNKVKDAIIKLRATTL